MRGPDFDLLAFPEMNTPRGVALSVLPTANHTKTEMVDISTGKCNWHESRRTGPSLGGVNVTNNLKGPNWSAVNYCNDRTAAGVDL